MRSLRSAHGALAAGAVLALLALGCGAGSDARTPSAPQAASPEPAEAPAAPTVDCETRVQFVPSRKEPPSLRGRNYTGAGPATFTTGFIDVPRQKLRPVRGKTTPIKAPIFVDAGSAVTIQLTGRTARRVEMEVGRDSGRSVRGSAVRLVPCDPEATVADRPVGHVTPFAVGFKIPGATCMRVSVLADGAAEPVRRRIPFGRGTCRGLS